MSWHRHCPGDKLILRESFVIFSRFLMPRILLHKIICWPLFDGYTWINNNCVVVLIATKCLYVCVITLVCWYRKTFKNKHSLDLHRLRFHELGHPGRISESWRSCFYIHSNRMMQYLFRICGDMSVFFWSVVAISFYSIVFENRWCIAILNSMGISHWPQFFFL